MLIPIIHHDHIAGYQAGQHFTQSEISIPASQISDIANYVPYSGASGNVDLGTYELSSGNINILSANLMDKFVGTSANYKFVWSQGYATGDYNILGLQQQIADTQSKFRFFTLNGDEGDHNTLEIYGLGTPTNQLNRHRLAIGWNSLGYYQAGVIYSGAGGPKPLYLSANATPESATLYQLSLAINGYVGIKNSNPLHPLDVTGNIHGSANLYLGSGYLDIKTNVLGQTVSYITELLFTQFAGMFDVLILGSNSMTVGTPDWTVNQFNYGTIKSYESIEAEPASGFKLGDNATITYDSTSEAIEFNVIGAA